jgi:hypothetical protein
VRYSDGLMLYYFHIHDGDQIITDHEGAYFESFELAEKEARASARDLAAHLSRGGKSLEGRGIEIADEFGTRLSFLPFPSLVD